MFMCRCLTGLRNIPRHAYHDKQFALYREISRTQSPAKQKSSATRNTCVYGVLKKIHSKAADQQVKFTKCQSAVRNTRNQKSISISASIYISETDQRYASFSLACFSLPLLKKSFSYPLLRSTPSQCLPGFIP